MVQNNYRPAIFRHVGVTQSDPTYGDVKIGIVLDLPWHQGAPACRLNILADTPLPGAAYSGAQTHHPGNILVGLPYYLQQAIGSAGVSLGIRDTLALRYDLNRVRSLTA